jgi:hypothetical protein
LDLTKCKPLVLSETGARFNGSPSTPGASNGVTVKGWLKHRQNPVTTVTFDGPALRTDYSIDVRVFDDACTSAWATVLMRKQ